MRYNMIRKYPIVEMKKNCKNNKQDNYIDMSLGTAVAIAGLLFAGGLIVGCIAKKY